MTPQTSPYDALLLVSFGGPERPEDVMSFLRNVTAGRSIPDERLAEVGAHYDLFGGRSPINDQNRALLEAIRADLGRAGVDIGVYWGNRNWDPYLVDAVEQMRADGVTRAACFLTSAYSSYSGCRQYRENLGAVVAATPGAPTLDRLRAYFNHPGFIEPMIDNTVAALDRLPAGLQGSAPILYVTHSLPLGMARTSGPRGDAYVAQHTSVMNLVQRGVAARTGRRHPGELVYCSRSGPPHMPWLEPDINDRLRQFACEGVGAVVASPIGFVSDHMEVAYDLDTEAAATANGLGLAYARAASCGTDPRFVAMIRDLLLERASTERGESPERTCLGDLGAAWDLCAEGCCPNPTGPRPTIGQA